MMVAPMSGLCRSIWLPQIDILTLRLRSEEISAGQHRKVSPDEFYPGRRPFALRRGRYTVTAQNIAHRLIGDMILPRL
jgi:hypothetical protein